MRRIGKLGAGNAAAKITKGIRARGAHAISLCHGAPVSLSVVYKTDRTYRCDTCGKLTPIVTKLFREIYLRRQQS